MKTTTTKQIPRHAPIFRTSNVVAREVPSEWRGEKKRELTGLIPYNSKSANLGGYVEVIMPGAFRETLIKATDVKALFAHDTSKILGRVRNGTLKLRDTPEGLECTVILPSTSYANDLYNLIKRNDVNTMSFGFNEAKTREETKDGKVTSYLLSVNLLEVSFGVAFPAYEDSTTEARDIHQSTLAEYLAGLSTEELVRLNESLSSKKNKSYDEASKALIAQLYEASKNEEDEKNGIKIWPYIPGAPDLS